MYDLYGVDFGIKLYQCYIWHCSKILRCKFI